MADINEAAIAKLTEDTLAEVVVLVSVVVQLLAAAFNPFLRRNDRAEAIALLTSSLPGLLKAIASGIVAVIGGQFPGLSDLILGVINNTVGPLMQTLGPQWHGLIKGVLDAYVADVAAHPATSTDTADSASARALQRASTFALGSRGVTLLFELLFPKSLNVFNWLGPTLAQFAGYDKIVEYTVGSQLREALGNWAEYKAAAQFKSRAPEHLDAVMMRARGLITEEQYGRLVNWAGIMTEFEAPLLANAHRALSPFLLARVADTDNITDADVRDLLVFGGLRPVDVDRMITVVHDLQVKPYRQAALSASKTAYERGVLTDAEFDGDLTQYEVPAAAKPFVKLETSVRKLQQLDEIYRKSVSEGYKYGTISDADYVTHLMAIGINEADANAHYSLDAIVKVGKGLAAEQRAELAAEKRDQRAAVANAQAQYRAGTIGDAELAAELLTAGLDPAMVAAAVGIAQARRAGSLRHVAGQLLSYDKAVVLAEKIAALGEQVYKKLVTPADAKVTLKDLGVPDANANALVAKWAAEAKLLSKPL